MKDSIGIVDFLDYAKDLATVQALRMGANVSMETLERVADLGETMVALTDAEALLKGCGMTFEDKDNG